MTISGQAASARRGHSTTDRVHQAYGNIPQWTCSPLKSRIAPALRHTNMAAPRLVREYELEPGFRYRRSDHSDDRIAGASAGKPAAGCPGLRKRSSPPDAASGSADKSVQVKLVLLGTSLFLG